MCFKCLQGEGKSKYVTFEFVCQKEEGKKTNVPNYWKIYWLNFTSHKLDILYKKKRRPYFEEKMWVKYRDNLINIHLKYLDY